jgi:hypothetical protein
VRLTEYILTPSDLVRIGSELRGLERRDLLGIVLAVAVFILFKLLLNQNSEDSLFMVVLFGSLWWRLDPRIPLVGAIGVLVLIPILQFFANSNILWIDDPSEPLAVIAYYLLVIGVLGQVQELRAEGGEGKREGVIERGEPHEPVRRRPVRPVKMRDMETIKKLRANREALRRRDW